jgi:hypothetical protein
VHVAASRGHHERAIQLHRLIAFSQLFERTRAVSSLMNTKTFRVWLGFIFFGGLRFGIEARARTKGVRHFARTPLVAEVPRSSSPRHGPSLIGSVPEAEESNSISVENRSNKHAQNSTFRIVVRESSPGFDRARATKLFRDFLGGPRLDDVTGLNRAYVLMRQPS